MPTRNVSLTDELDSYVEQSVQSGHFDNASEVIRAAIRELKQSEEEDKAKVEALRVAIAEGLRGPFNDGPTVMADMRERVRLRAERNRKKANIA
jgi:antitoxin ParD1/3/4